MAKWVAMILVVVFAGGANLCACVAMATEPAKAAAPIENDPHACCHPEDQTPAPSAPTTEHESCSHCQQLADLKTLAPEQSSIALELSALTVLAPVNELLTAITPISTFRTFYGVDSHAPPLLLDLVHSNCQLTV